ncbi:MAG TPA: hypothetical protein VGH28_23490 [Polyangiaceae bacterium]
MKLTPGQRVLAAVAYDGVQPGELVDADLELARAMFGELEEIPSSMRAVVVAVCGARGGKSYVLCALRLLYLALTVPIDAMAPGEQACGLIVAPDLRLARQTIRYALGAARSCVAIARRIRSITSDSFALAREDGRIVTIECLPATRGGAALRGRTLVGAVLDEAAFFRDEDYSVNDAEVFRAIAPRVVPEGQIVIASTPWAEGVGLLHTMFAENHGHPRTAIAAHAPTTLLRSDERTRAMVERERDRDPDNAAREFDAEFMASGAGLFFDARAIDASAAAPDPHPNEAGILAVGADFGFKSDSSALAVVRLGVSGIVRIVELVELRPRKGSPLVPSVVAKTFAEVMARHGATDVLSDSFAYEAMREHMQAAGARLIAAASGLTAKIESYTRAKTMLNEGRVRLPSDNRRLIAQLKAVTSKPTSGGGLSISSPRRASGGHGDLVSALVLAMGALPATDYATNAAGLFDPNIQPLFAEAS